MRVAHPLSLLTRVLATPPGTSLCGPFQRGVLVIFQGPGRRVLPAAKRVSLSTWEQGKRGSFHSLPGPTEGRTGPQHHWLPGLHQPTLPTPLLVTQGQGAGGAGSASESSWKIQLFLTGYSHKKNKNKIGVHAHPFLSLLSEFLILIFQ